MAGKLKTISELALSLEVPDSTARRWAKQLADLLPAETIGRAIRYKPEAEEILKQAAELFGEGRTAGEVHHLLSQTYIRTVSGEPEENHQDEEALPVVANGERLPDGLRQALKDLVREVVQEEVKVIVQDQLERSRQELAAVQEVAEQKRRQHEEERDKKLMEAIRKLQEQAEKPWWRRLLG